MATKSMWRLLTVMSAAVFALAIAASAFAQAPPAIPHGFYGVGGSAMLDGAPAADGAVGHRDQPGRRGRRFDRPRRRRLGHRRDPDDAESVTFSIDGSDPSDSYEVTQGGDNEVSLDLHSPMGDDDDADDMGDTDDADDMGDTDDADDMGDTDDADDMGDTDDADDTDAGDGDDADDMGDEPMALPDTGSGGLAGGSSLPVLPLALAISIVVALGGVMAVRRTRA